MALNDSSGNTPMHNAGDINFNNIWHLTQLGVALAKITILL